MNTRRANRARLMLSATLALGCLAAGAQTASASTPPTLPGPSQPSIQAVSPSPTGSYWQLTAKPGATIALTAEVRNGGDTSATFALGSTGAGTGATTGIGYTFGQGSTVGWVTGLPATVTLAAHKHTMVHATLVVPSDAATPYQYIGGLEALGLAATPSGRRKGNVSIAQRDAAVVAWVVTVGTPTAEAISFGTPVVRATVAPEVDFPSSNVGQGIYAPKVDLSVYSGACTVPAEAGKPLFSTTRQWGATVPGTSWSYPVYVGSVLVAGTYCAVEQTVPGQPTDNTFTVSQKQQKTETTTPGLPKITQPAHSTSSNSMLLVVVALALIIIALLLLLLLRRRRDDEDKSDEAVKPDEAVKS